MIEKINKIINTFPTSERLKDAINLLNENVEEWRIKFAIESSLILISYNLDEESVLANILFQVLKNTLSNKDELIKKYGEDVYNIIETVCNLQKIDVDNNNIENENIRKMFIALAKDIRVVIIKLSHILQQLKGIQELSSEEFISICEETQDIYAPLAGRLGLSKLKCELEDIAFKNLNPEIYNELSKSIFLNAEEQNKQIEITISNLKQMLVDLNIKGEVFGRTKHFCSIYKKMKNKLLDLSQIYDLVAVRVIVDTIDECYMVLGKIHTIYKPIPGRFKDYISLPKPNGYQSLHTSVVAENDRPIEVQVRTKDMHRVAEYGVCAHWMYKENKTKASSLDQRLLWVRQIMEKSENSNPTEFVESLKMDLYSGAVFAQSPLGKVMEFPEGSCVVDFAYAIHTDVGNHCVGGKINGKIVPLYTQLQNGDVVEIITQQNNKGPSRDWLKITKTSSAKQKINNFFKSTAKEENIKEGKIMLENAAKSKSYTLSKLINEKSLASVFYKYSLVSEDDMYAAIGYGGLSCKQILNKLINEYDQNQDKNPLEIEIKPVKIKKDTKDSIIVRGQGGLLTRFAGCCTPVPGDEIVGFVSHGNGITVHRKDCKQILSCDKDRIIEAVWADNVISNFSVALRVVISDKIKFISKLTPILSGLKIDLSKLDLGLYNGKMCANIVAQIKSVSDLDKLIKEIQKLDEVIECNRI